MLRLFIFLSFACELPIKLMLQKIMWYSIVVRTLSWMAGFPNTFARMSEQTGFELLVLTSSYCFLIICHCVHPIELYKLKILSQLTKFSIRKKDISTIFLPSHFQFSKELVCPAHSVVTAGLLGGSGTLYTGGAIKRNSEQSLSQLAADHLKDS